MSCPACGHENRATARFCGNCGSPLATVACPSCGAGNPVGQRFCDACGKTLDDAAPAPAVDPRSFTPAHLAERIRTARASLQGERKRVTVLFADVKGSMDLADSIQTEAYHRIMDRFLAILSEGVHRFEGTVAQFTGDGIMALFGAPIAHEDHAQRACYAALYLTETIAEYATELRRAEGVSFSVRMGLNSGEVVVDTIGDDLHMDYIAHGHTVGLAKRMEQLAEPGKVFVTEHTAALVAGYVRLADLGTFTIKGVHDPVHVYQLEGMGRLRTRLEVARTRGLSRFVGRQEEMAILDGAFQRVAAGNGQVVGVVAEPGLGKSRLCFEFVERARARGVEVHEGHAVAHGTMIPFLPILEALRSYFTIDERDGDQAARQKIAGALVLLDEQLQDVLPLMFEFMGVPDPQRPPPRRTTEARQRQLFGVLKRLVHARGARRPTILFLEDLHWIDGGSDVFLEQLVEGLAGTRTLLLLTFRPEFQAAWMQVSYCRQIPLQPLAPAASDELLRDLLGGDGSVATLAARIRARTGGNPFFIEEVVQGLVEAGNLQGSHGAYRLARPVESELIPDSVQTVLAARIDRLSERDKAVLQTAAVIGKKVGEPVLERVVSLPPAELASALRALVRGEFLYETTLFPEAEYAFKHPLTREVAYRSQLTERRAPVHAAVARVMAELYPDRLDERAALLAHHWEGAGEALEAARWSRRAAEWAGYSEPREAIRHWRKLRSLLATLPASAETAALGVTTATQLLNLGWRLGITPDEAKALYTEAKAAATSASDKPALARLLSAYAAVQAAAGEVQEAHDKNTEAVRIAELTNDADLQLALRNRLVLSHLNAGRLRETLVLVEQALERTSESTPVGADLLGYRPYINLMRMRGMLLAYMGRLQEADVDLVRAEELARASNEIEVLVWTHLAFVYLARCRRDGGAALSHARQAIEIAERNGTPYWRAQGHYAIGLAHVLGQSWSEAVAALEPALAIARERRTSLQLEAHMLASLGEAYLGNGDADRAHAAADEAVRLARAHGTRLWECEALLARGRIRLALDGVAAGGDIENDLTDASALVVETGARSLAPFVHRERARLARLLGDAETERAELASAAELFAEIAAVATADGGPAGDA